jgi:hypothetical protein
VAGFFFAQRRGPSCERKSGHVFALDKNGASSATSRQAVASSLMLALGHAKDDLIGSRERTWINFELPPAFSTAQAPFFASL